MNYSNVEFFLGDCRELMKQQPDQSVQCMVTSPPYFGLRDYGVAGQIGNEQTPDEYVDELVALFREGRRVLRDDGTLWLNLGDSYCNNPGNGRGGEGRVDGGLPHRSGMDKSRLPGLKQKDLIGIPWMVAFALRADGWFLRSDIVWHKPNPMPESVTDRPTRAHEYIFLLTKSAKYYYDHEAIKEPLSSASIQRLSQPSFDQQTGGKKDYANGVNKHRSARRALVNLKGRAVPPQVTDNPEQYASLTGRNKRDVWTVTTKPFKEAHFATFPPDLIEPCILAGSKPGDVVLDPFNGAGTTGLVSVRLGRRYKGFDLNPEYLEISRRRVFGTQIAMVQL